MNIDGIEFDNFGEKDPRKASRYHFYGATEIRYDTAVRADVSRQNYSVCPRHWFIEADFRCGDCQREFTFSVREQRFWYETRKFYVDSYPTRCPRCRRFQRTKLLLKQKYDAVIETALRRNASAGLKREALQAIDAFAASSNTPLPEKMRRNRRLLAEQIASKVKRAARGGS